MPLPSSLVTADSPRRQTLACSFPSAKSQLTRAVPAAAAPRFRSDGMKAPHSPFSAPSDNATSWRIPTNRIPQPAAGTSPAAEPAADAPVAAPTAAPTAHGPAAAWPTLDLKITAEEAEWIVCPAPLTTLTPAAPPAPSASRAAGLPGRALRSCVTALSQLTGSVGFLVHSLPHRRQRQQQQHAAPEHTTLDLEVTGAEAMWLANADAAIWDLPAVAETNAVTAAESVAVPADDVLPLPPPPPPPRPRR